MRAGKDTGRIPGLPSKAQIWGPESPCCSLNLTSPASSHRCFIGGGVRGSRIGVCQHGEAGDGFIRSGAFYVIGQGSRFGFLWLVLSWSGEKIRAVGSY